MRSFCLVATCIALFTSGCAKSPSLGSVDPIFIGKLEPEMRWDQAIATKLKRPYSELADLRTRYYLSADGALSTAEPIDAATTRVDGRSSTQPGEIKSNVERVARTNDSPERLRNRIINVLFSWIDEYHENFKIHLYAVRASEDTMFDLAVLGLNAAGTVAGGEALKSVLAATAAAVTGTKLAVNKNFFYEQTITAVIAQMDARRNQKKRQILERMSASDEKYPLPAAEQDLLEYFYSGSLVNGLVSISDDASTKRARSQSALNQAYEAQYATNATRTLRDLINHWLNSNLETNLPQLEDWLGQQEPPVTISAPTWIEDANTTEADLERAIAELGIEQQ